MAQVFNEAEMTRTLQPLLSEGETVEAAVYCIYKETGFWARSHNIITGYVGITDCDRLIGCKMGLLDRSALAFDLRCLEKIKLSGSLFGQKMVDLTFLGVKKDRVKFQIAPKIYGDRFPDQEKNLKLLLERLEEKRAALPN